MNLLQFRKRYNHVSCTQSMEVDGYHIPLRNFTYFQSTMVHGFSSRLLLFTTYAGLREKPEGCRTIWIGRFDAKPEDAELVTISHLCTSILLQIVSRNCSFFLCLCLSLTLSVLSGSLSACRLFLSVSLALSVVCFPFGSLPRTLYLMALHMSMHISICLFR